jgi:hypothetical protein
MWTRHTVTPEHAKTPPAAETHTTNEEQQNTQQSKRKRGKDATPQNIAIRPTHSNIET